jgi:hypothetical protein
VEADATTRAGDQDGIGDRRGRGHGVLLEDPVEGEDSRRVPREHA